jgi:hypothetical protein
LSREVNELRAAGEEDVLTVINFNSVELEGRGAAAEQPASLEKLDVRSSSFQTERRRQAG